MNWEKIRNQLVNALEAVAERIGQKLGQNGDDDDDERIHGPICWTCGERHFGSCSQGKEVTWCNKCGCDVPKDHACPHA